MSNDDILWKNIEALKHKERTKSRSGQRPQLAGPSPAAKSPPLPHQRIKEVSSSRLQPITPDGDCATLFL